MTKRYHVCKIVFADNINDLLSIENSGEIINIELKDEITNPSEIGFTKCYGKEKRNRN